uniref:Uncharacterized protein n=1 Tax=Apteryx owenii TaxID=8824 RepID=A0A8B9SF63_APTOW
MHVYPPGKHLGLGGGGGDTIMEKTAVIIDNGSSFTRAGFAGQNKPTFVLRTMSLTSPSPIRPATQPQLVLCIQATLIIWVQPV